jgi:hypothetical protein
LNPNQIVHATTDTPPQIGLVLKLDLLADIVAYYKGQGESRWELDDEDEDDELDEESGDDDEEIDLEAEEEKAKKRRRV